MRAGSLRQRVVLLAPTASVGATFRDPQHSYAAAATVWAAVEPLNGREVVRNQEQGGIAEAMMRIRYRADVNEKWRVQHGSTVYEIVAPPINPLSRRTELHLLCRRYHA